MAKLSAHGTEIGRIDYLTYRKAYMSDGAILKNYGSGWKLSAKCKPGVDPVSHFQKCLDHVASEMQSKPAFAAYKKALHDIAPISVRWKLDAAIRMMPDDVDGVWSECCDGYGDNVDASVDEIAEVCAAYRAALAEAKQ